MELKTNLRDVCKDVMFLFKKKIKEQGMTAFDQAKTQEVRMLLSNCNKIGNRMIQCEPYFDIIVINI